MGKFLGEACAAFLYHTDNWPGSQWSLAGATDLGDDCIKVLFEDLGLAEIS